MRKEISPELYNYNKFPGPEFKQVGSQILTDKISLNLVDNYREGFDLTAFNQRFSEILTKFDYIVGDWGNEQLRLRGFYKDDKSQENTTKISRLEDYLLEYCNYGCAYFVLENPQPQRAAFDKKSKAPSKKDGDSRNKRSRGSRSNRDKKGEQEARSFKPKRSRKKQFNKKDTFKDSDRHFVIRQK